MKHKNNSKFAAPIVILIRPQMAENVGMVARAMMNCGLSELRLVQPRESHLSAAALSASSGAQVILEQATVYDTLEQAVKDVHYLLATTARTRGMDKPVYGPDEAIEKINEKIHQNEKTALLFGPERTGLENTDLIFSDALVTIPLNPVHPSLNLAQAVLLLGWCWWQKSSLIEKMEKTKKTASKKEVIFFLNFMIQHLENKNYFSIENRKEKMQQNLINTFTKMMLSSAEIKTLYRVVEYLCKDENKKK